jgi:cytochrome c2
MHTGGGTNVSATAGNRARMLRLPLQLRYLPVLIFAGLLLVACGGDGSPSTADETPTTSSPATAAVATSTPRSATSTVATSQVAPTSTVAATLTATPVSVATPTVQTTATQSVPNTPTTLPTMTPEPTATETAQPSPTTEMTPTPEPTATLAPTATVEPTATPEPTAIPEPTATPEPPPTEVQVPAGQIVFEQQCGVCHTVQGTAAQGVIGPDLTWFGSQATIAGVVENNAANLWEWLADPQSIKPDTIMPALGLSADEISLLIDFLYSTH